MKEKIDICGSVTLLTSFILAIIGLCMENDLIFSISIIAFFVISSIYMTIQALLYIDFKNDNLPDIIEEDIDTFEDLRKEVKKIEDLLK